MVEGNLIAVEVVYALPGRQTLLSLAVLAGTTVRMAIDQSGISVMHPEIDFDTVPVGIYGRRVALAAVLEDHDRIEIYRPLIADAKQARRARAAARKKRQEP